MTYQQMTNAEIEEFCEGLVSDYVKKYNAPIDYVDIRGLMTDYLGLEIEFESIVEDDESITACLANGTRELQVVRDGKSVSVLYPPKTVVIDKCYLDADQRERCRFNMAHETGHYLMNKLCHASEVSFNRDVEVGEFIPMSQLHNAFHINEATANKFATALLMPKRVVENALAKLNNGLPVRVYGENIFDPEGRGVMKQMATLLGVKFQLLFLRLRQFGFLDYHPLEELLSTQIQDQEVRSE